MLCQCHGVHACVVCTWPAPTRVLIHCMVCPSGIAPLIAAADKSAADAGSAASSGTAVQRQVLLVDLLGSSWLVYLEV